MLDKTILAVIYLVGLFIAESVRFSRRIQHLKNRQHWKPAESSTQKTEWIVLTSVILGIWVLPVIDIFTPWLKAVDYDLPQWANWLAVVLFIFGLIVRLIAQQTLSQSWSSTLETSENHQLITHGIFAFTRHPIYLSLIFWAVAQIGLIQNYLAGLGGIAAVLLIWLVRVPREEKLMLEAFNDQYREYMAHTGRFFPKIDPGHSDSPEG